MYTLEAFCALGAEKVLVNELKKLKLPILDSLFGRVRFTAELEGIYQALISLRSADRILLEVARYTAMDFDQLFEGAYEPAWEDLIPRGRTITIGKVRIRGSRLSAATSVQAVMHKAIAQKLCEKWGVRRLNDGADPAELRVFLEKDTASILLDLSGEPLFKRGYRVESIQAPLRETCAAAMLQMSLWRRKTPLYDPMCGSGTILIEAMLYAWDAAPGLKRHFALESLPFADSSLESRVRQELRARVNFANVIRVAGSDRDPEAIRIARSNASRALDIALEPGADKPASVLPRFEQLELSEARPPAAWTDAGLLLTNPPWGERLGDQQQAEECYALMKGLGERFPLWSLGVITSHPHFESHRGLRADTVRELSNGALKTKFFTYNGLQGGSNVNRRQA